VAAPWVVVECDAATALTPVGLVSAVEQAVAAAASAAVVEVTTVLWPDQPVGLGPPAWLPWVEVAAVAASPRARQRRCRRSLRMPTRGRQCPGALLHSGEGPR
jgi:hypothetical protein